MRQAVLAALALVLTVTSPLRAQDDECTAPLRMRQNIIKIDKTKTDKQNFRDFFCSDEFEKYVSNQKAEGGVTIPVKPVPIEFKFGSDNSSSMEKRKQLCKLKAIDISLETIESIYIDGLSDEVRIAALEAYGICQEKRKRAGALVELFLSPIGTGEAAKVSAQFNRPLLPPGSKVPNPMVVRLIASSGLQCPPKAFVPGAAITPQSITEECKWTPKTNVIRDPCSQRWSAY
jgi:hypothetical protein